MENEMNEIMRMRLEEIKPKKGYGIIYYAYCETANKGYVGQASNYVSGNTKWGVDGRWKSHVREATSGNKDHCLILNQAIRKYGQDSFVIIAVKEVPSEELNDWEIYFINLFRTLSPNGYNLHGGGGKNKVISEESRKKHSESKKGVPMSEEARINNSQGQLGGRRNGYKRNNPEDEHLPKYINAKRLDGILVGYEINSFPIGVESKDYITKSFRNIRDPKSAYLEAIKYLEQLKTQYAYVQIEINKKRDEHIQQRITSKLERKFFRNIDNPYIKPIITDNKLDGYYVEGYLDNNSNPYPRKYFNELASNQKNLMAAKRYIDELQVLNKNTTFKEDKIDTLVNVGKIYGKRSKTQGKRNPDNVNMPKYLAYIIVNGEKVGYQVNNFPMSKTEKIKKKFCGKKIPMEVKFKSATEFLEELWKKKNALNASQETNNLDSDNNDDTDYISDIDENIQIQNQN
jgi:hypothetical protein